MEYMKPDFQTVEFNAQQAVAGCDLNIVSGTNTVQVYCAQTSYVTVFTDRLGCAYKRDPFTSTSEAESFFSHLFQWGEKIAEGGNVTNNTTTKDWTVDQKIKANWEIYNGRTTLEGTVDLGGYGRGGHGSRVHAGYALDYLNGFEEGKALS